MRCGRNEGLGAAPFCRQYIKRAVTDWAIACAVGCWRVCMLLPALSRYFAQWWCDGGASSSWDVGYTSWCCTHLLQHCLPHLCADNTMSTAYCSCKIHGPVPQTLTKLYTPRFSPVRFTINALLVWWIMIIAICTNTAILFRAGQPQSSSFICENGPQLALAPVTDHAQIFIHALGLQGSQIHLFAHPYYTVHTLLMLASCMYMI